jgi:RNA recognition motif-containing protein
VYKKSYRCNPLLKSGDNGDPHLVGSVFEIVKQFRIPACVSDLTLPKMCFPTRPFEEIHEGKGGVESEYDNRPDAPKSKSGRSVVAVASSGNQAGAATSVVCV